VTVWPSPGLTGKVVGAVAYNFGCGIAGSSRVGPPQTLVGRTVAAVGARSGSPSSAPIFGASPQKLVWGALNRFFLDPLIPWRRLIRCPSIFLGLHFVRGSIRPTGQAEADTLPEVFDSL